MHTTGESQATVSDVSEAEQISSEGSTWDEASESAAIMEPLDDNQEGDLTQFLMDTFGNTETTLDDLIQL